MVARGLAGALIFTACILLPFSARAQAIYEISSNQKEYSEAFIELLSQWESGEVTFSKRLAGNQLQERLELFLVRQTTDALDQLFSLSFIQDNWENAPEVLAAELPLSAGAYSSILGGILDAADVLAAQGISPTPDGLREALHFSTFITLAAAQAEAQQAGESEITAAAVRRGGIYFFSLGWPFCCAIGN